MKKHLFWFGTLTLGLAACTGGSPTPPPAPSANCPAAQWTLMGSAQQSSGRYELTPDSGLVQGAMFNQNPLNLSQNFDCTYRVFLGNNDLEGADGVVYAWTSQIPDAGSYNGGVGRQLGFGQLEEAILGIELDTWAGFDNAYDPGHTGDADPSNDHLAVIYPRSSQTLGHQEHLPGDTVVGLGKNLEDGREHVLRVVWLANNRTLEVYLDGTKYLSYAVSQAGFSGNSVYVGFTSSTGLAANLHYVKP